MATRINMAARISVKDNTVLHRGHGGSESRRGCFDVLIGSVAVWTEHDAFQHWTMARDRCLKLALLLRAARREGARNGRP